MNKVVLISLLVLASISCADAFRKQKVSIKGRVFCGDKPAADVTVKLVEEDSG